MKKQFKLIIFGSLLILSIFNSVPEGKLKVLCWAYLVGMALIGWLLIFPTKSKDTNSKQEVVKK